MKRSRLKSVLLSSAFLAMTGSAVIAAGMIQPAHARTSTKTPALVISNEPLPASLQQQIYSKPAKMPEITPRDVLGPDYYVEGKETIVGRKVTGLRNDLFALQGGISDLSEKLARIEEGGQTQAAEYYASVATINAQLQAGTTPGNPRLVQKLSIARKNLESLSDNIAALNNLAVDINGAASMSAYLLESTRAAYGLSGAIEEDHVRLAQLEDAINSTIVVIDRLLNNVNDDITRTAAYLSTERENLRTLALAINKGDLFGKSLSNRPFSSAAQASFVPGAPAPAYQAAAPAYQDTPYPAPAPAAAMAPASPRPLVKIRFDRSNVSYEQPVYLAVNEALARYPQARFELVAVHPSRGNAAEVAIESTRARRNAERVLRSLTEMGLELDRVDLSYTSSPEAATNEVHLYIR